MINKKGDLLKDILSLVVALIGLLILFIAFYKLYKINVTQETENAKNTLEGILAKIEALSEGEKTSFLIQGFDGAEKWYLVGWGKNEPYSIKPERCLLKSCICVCNGADKKSCENEGICRDLEQENVEVYTKIVNFKGDFGDFENVEEYSKKCVKLRENLFEIEIKKEQNLLNVIHYNEIDENIKLNCALKE